MSWRRKIAAPAVCALIVLLAAACGGGDAKPNASATATQQSGASTNASTPAPVVTGTSGGTSAASRTAKVTAPPGGLIDACTLLTKAEIAAAVGETTDGNVSNDPPTYSCFWDSTDDLMTTKVELVLYVGSDAQGASDDYDIVAGDAVASLGDKAKWEPLGTLQVLQGNYDFAVYVTRPTSMTEIDQQNISKGLAQKILARLL